MASGDVGNFTQGACRITRLLTALRASWLGLQREVQKHARVSRSISAVIGSAESTSRKVALRTKTFRGREERLTRSPDALVHVMTFVIVMMSGPRSRGCSDQNSVLVSRHCMFDVRWHE